MTTLRLTVLPEKLAVCRLGPAEDVPQWVAGAFTSVTRTPDELSIVCDDQAVPPHVRAERGWRLLRVEGPLPFELTGIAAAFVTPLADARISVFPIATFDTDYLLVKEECLAAAVEALRSAGHDVA